MSGGVSRVDTFDYKPDLVKYNGVALGGGIAGVQGEGKVIVRQGYPGPLLKSPFTFQQYGESGTLGLRDFPAHVHHRGRSGVHPLGDWKVE